MLSPRSLGPDGGPRSHEGRSDGSGLQPEDDRGKDQHRPVIECAFLIAGGEATPLFEAIDAALDHVAPCVDGLIKDQWTTRPRSPLRLLVASLGNRVRDLPLAQQSATARVAIAFVGDDAVWARPWPSTSSRAWDMDAAQHRFQLGTIVAVARRDHDRERSPLPVTGQMKLGGEPSTAPSESLVDRMLDPLFISARLRRRRAPLAW